MTSGAAKRQRLAPSQLLEALQDHENALAVCPYKQDEHGFAVGTIVPYTTLFKWKHKKEELVKVTGRSVPFSFVKCYV